MPPDTPVPDPATTISEAELIGSVRLLLATGDQLIRGLAAQEAPASEKIEDFERLSRTVRRTVLLARHLADRPARDRAAAKSQARRQIIRGVQDAIGRARQPQERVNSLNDELYERLEAPELDEELENRPIHEIISEIRRDLGLDPSSPRRSPADIAKIAAIAAAATRKNLAPRQLVPEPTPHLPPNAPCPDEDDDEDVPDPFPSARARPGSLLESLLSAPVRDG